MKPDGNKIFPWILKESTEKVNVSELNNFLFFFIIFFFLILIVLIIFISFNNFIFF